MVWHETTARGPTITWKTKTNLTILNWNFKILHEKLEWLYKLTLEYIYWVVIIHQHSSENKVNLKLVFEALVVCKFLITGADLPADFYRSSRIDESLAKWKHKFFTSDGLKFSVKTFPKVGNFELKSYPKG